jgi:hypothetical protein
VDRLAELEAGDVAVLARALSIVAVVIPGADPNPERQPSWSGSAGPLYDRVDAVEVECWGPVQPSSP